MSELLILPHVLIYFRGFNSVAKFILDEDHEYDFFCLSVAGGGDGVDTERDTYFDFSSY